VQFQFFNLFKYIFNFTARFTLKYLDPVTGPLKRGGGNSYF
jgi:hypothetical protein